MGKIIKKAILAAVLSSAITAGVYAQEESAQNDFVPTESMPSEALPPVLTMPLNTITVDLGPTIVGAIFSHIGDMIKSDEDMKEITDAIHSSGFGISLQYERQISEKWSVGGRFAYLDCSVGIWDEEVFAGGESEKLTLDMSLVSFSLEIHARYFPFTGTFFVDGMMGYGSLAVEINGGLFITTSSGTKEQAELEFTASRNYLKYGIKTGWRIDFGKPGGFVFEPSLGYYGAVGIGKTIAAQVSDEVGDGEADYNFDNAFNLLENFIFIGGPRLSLSFGWRF